MEHKTEISTRLSDDSTTKREKPPASVENVSSVSVSQYQGTTFSTGSLSTAISTSSSSAADGIKSASSTFASTTPGLLTSASTSTSVCSSTVANDTASSRSIISSTLKTSRAPAVPRFAQSENSEGKNQTSTTSGGNSSVSGTSLAKATGEQSSLPAADAQGDSPNKLLQAVRSTNLPYPLPVPTYSQAVQAARASGNVLSERATIIRETVKFFLSHKYWWTSDDYDRIAELVVNEFPELRDPFTWPSQPCYSKVRLDLSMCARNIRRIAKNQEKRRGSPRRHSSESAEVPTDPTSSASTSKASKGSAKAAYSGRRSSAQLSRSPTMVPQSVSQLLPHTAHTAHSALAASTALMDQKQVANTPYLLTSVSSSVPAPASTVLPPVAHFLGHAPPHGQGPGGIVFPSLVPATAVITSTSTVASTVAGLALPQVSPAITSELNSFSSIPATEWPAKQMESRLESALNNVATISSACCPDTQLPDPLPVPPYSDKRRVRADLSQTARNIRRREVMLKRRDSRSPEDRFTAVGTVTSLVTPTMQQPATDFCNELLAAASIIESRTAAMQHKDPAEQLPDTSRDTSADTSVIAHTDTSKTVHPDVTSKIHASTSKKDKSVVNTSRNPSDSVGGATPETVQTSSGVVLTDPKGATAENKETPVVSVTPSSEMAVIKHEVEEEDLEQQQALHAQWQTLSQMSQALSMQALSAQMSHALSAAQISEHMSSHVTPRTSRNQASATQSAQQLAPTTSSSATSLSLQQLSQAHAYSLAATSGAGDETGNESSHVDRMSAMAMWRSTCLPDPLPTPPYSLNVLRARDAGNTASARPRIIRETTQFFLAMKMWWTTQDYERIAELVLRHFPALKSVQNIKKDLGTCARNMRRRLPLSRYKPSAYSKQWASYQSPPHRLLKDTISSGEGDGQGRAGVTLGELATMASLREAVGQCGQDKGIAEAVGIGVLTEEQRQTLLAHSMYEQSTLAWNALYQQQFPTSAAETPTIPQARSTKRSLSDTTALKVAETLERDVLGGPYKRHTSVEQTPKQLAEADTARCHSVDVSSGELQAQDLKIEPVRAADYGKKVADPSKTNEAYVGLREQTAAHTPTARDQRQMSDSAVYLAGPPVSAVSESLVHAHQKPARAHSQSSVQMRQEPSSAEEAPINLTCSTVSSKQQQHGGEKDVTKQDSHSPKRSRSSSMETFSAREQVWFPHGSPWKKSGQTLFKALPNPLPIPKYSQKLLKAREEGLAYRHRSEVVRETARFFLSFKYWWSSADYSRISELVVSEFPDLKDPVTHPGQPSYRRVQRDLSMCARNLRRKNTRRQKLSLAEATRSPKKSKSGISKEKKSGKESKPAEKNMVENNNNPQIPVKAASSENFQQSSSAAKLLPQTATVSTASTHSLVHALVSGAAQHTMSADTVSRAVADVLPQDFRSSSAVAALLSADSHARAVRSSSEWNLHPSGSVHKSMTGQPAVGYLLSTPTSTAVSSHLASTDAVQSFAVTAPVTSAIKEQRETYVSKEVESSNGTAQRSLKGSHGMTSRENLASVKHDTKSNRQKVPLTQNTDTKSAVSSSHEAHQSALSGDGSMRRPVVQTVSGAGKSASRNETGQHARWAPGLGTFSQASSSRQAVSNTTAIVTPTLSEAPAHSTDPRVAEGSISHKVYIDPDHGSELQAQLTKLWQDGKFFDASLEVDGYRLPVHKLVLLAASPYLQSTFRHANPTSHLEVNLPRDTAVGAARDFLKYVYQGVLHVGPDTVHALRRIAAMLQIEKLLTYCDDYLRLLNTGFSASFSLPDTLSHATSQVPRVSVNLRDPAHNHVYSTDDGITLARLPQTSDAAHVPPSAQPPDHAQDLVPASSRHAPSRKRRASSTVTSQSSHLPVTARKKSQNSSNSENMQCLESDGILPTNPLVSQTGCEQVQQDPVHISKHIRLAHQALPEEQVGISHSSDADHSRLVQFAATNDQPKAVAVLDPQTELVYEGDDYQQFRLIGSQLATTDHQEQVLVQHSHDPDRLGTSSVIQRGPNMASTNHTLSSKVGRILTPHEEAVQFLTESDQVHLEGDVLVQTHLDDEMVTLLPQEPLDDQGGDDAMVAEEDGELDREALAAASLGTLACDGGDVVEEVVVSAGDLLHDVEVAACETVECSLLPQTYCSSPEAQGSPVPNTVPSPALPSLATEWTTQHYHSKTHYSVDNHSPQQWVALQEGLYGHTSPHPGIVASSASVDETAQQEGCEQQVDQYEDQQDSYQAHSVPSATAVYIATHTTADKLTSRSQLLMSQANAATSSQHEEIMDTSQGSLLPQTYCSSPEHAVTDK